MTNAEIKEFKNFLIQILVKNSKMSETKAYRAVRDSYLSEALKRDSDYVMHDTIDEWARFVFYELQNEQLLQM